MHIWEKLTSLPNTFPKIFYACWDSNRCELPNNNAVTISSFIPWILLVLEITRLTCHKLTRVQSNLAKGCIINLSPLMAVSGFVQFWSTSKIWFLGPTWVPTPSPPPNSISIGLVIFTQHISEINTQTDTQTTLCVTSVAISTCVQALWPKNHMMNLLISYYFACGSGCKVLWWVHQCVCLFVYPSMRISPKPHARSLPNFCACCLWPWLGPPPASLHCIMYLQFCGWRHFSFLWSAI